MAKDLGGYIEDLVVVKTTHDEKEKDKRSFKNRTVLKQVMTEKKK